MDAYYFTPLAYEALKRGLPNANWVDANLLVNWVRAVKSREGNRVHVAGGAHHGAGDESGHRRGRAGHSANAMRQPRSITRRPPARAEFGGDYTAFVPMLPTGVGTSTPHLTWSDAKFVKGEPTILELGGRPPPLSLPDGANGLSGQAAARNWRIRRASCWTASPPGWKQPNPAPPAKRWRAPGGSTIAKHGIVKESRVGYSTGLNFPPIGASTP